MIYVSNFIFNCQKFHNINDVYDLQIHNIHVVDNIYTLNINDTCLQFQGSTDPLPSRL